jgi:hypothetical protein
MARLWLICDCLVFISYNFAFGKLANLGPSYHEAVEGFLDASQERAENTSFGGYESLERGSERPVIPCSRQRLNRMNLLHPTPRRRDVGIATYLAVVSPKSRRSSRQTATTASATRIPSETSAKRCAAAIQGASARGIRTIIASVMQA